MKQEQIIELVNKHGATRHGLPYSFSITIDNLTAVITEVEQATLEKITKHVYSLGWAAVHSDEVAEEILNIAKKIQ